MDTKVEKPQLLRRRLLRAHRAKARSARQSNTRPVLARGAGVSQGRVVRPGQALCLGYDAMQQCNSIVRAAESVGIRR